MTENNVRIMCPNLTCRKVLIVPSGSRGKTVRCKNCATTIRVPTKAAEPAAPASAAPGQGPGEDAKVA
jgi:LSD1 subclass zinc finger protein